jgi:hypothetical protein
MCFKSVQEMDGNLEHVQYLLKTEHVLQMCSENGHIFGTCSIIIQK